MKLRAINGNKPTFTENYHLAVPIDNTVFKIFYFAEIQRGMIGVGEYKLRKEFQVLQQDPNEVKIPKYYSPDEIVETVKKQINDPLTMHKKISNKNLKLKLTKGYVQPI